MYKWLAMWTLVVGLSCYVVYLEKDIADKELMEETVGADVDELYSKNEELEKKLNTHSQYIDAHGKEFQIHKQEIMRAQTQNIVLHNMMRELQNQVMLASKGGAFIVPPTDPKEIINDKDKENKDD